MNRFTQRFNAEMNIHICWYHWLEFILPLDFISATTSSCPFFFFHTLFLNKSKLIIFFFHTLLNNKEHPLESILKSIFLVSVYNVDIAGTAAINTKMSNLRYFYETYHRPPHLRLTSSHPWPWAAPPRRHVLEIPPTVGLYHHPYS